MRTSLDTTIEPLIDFLRVKTPHTWAKAAVENLPLLLLDHAHCERKAAMTALQMMSKYAKHPEIVHMMSPLAREELLHFEKVLDYMNARGIAFKPLPSCGYAQQLHALAAREDYSARLCQQLLIGAIIEARSCERFYALLPYLDDLELRRFYQSLVKAEARHFENYVHLAKTVHPDYQPALERLLDLENQLITAPCDTLRFHSGVPREYAAAV